MRASDGFFLGAITGAVVFGFWVGGRTQAAADLRALEEGAGRGCDCSGEPWTARRMTATEDWSCLITGLVGLAGRLWRWNRGRAEMRAVRLGAAG